jgi:predicted PolB exonuclease-like 3'-5' exonuclease
MAIENYDDLPNEQKEYWNDFLMVYHENPANLHDLTDLIHDLALKHNKLVGSLALNSNTEAEVFKLLIDRMK